MARAQELARELKSWRLAARTEHKRHRGIARAQELARELKSWPRGESSRVGARAQELAPRGAHDPCSAVMRDVDLTTRLTRAEHATDTQTKGASIGSRRGQARRSPAARHPTLHLLSIR